MNRIALIFATLALVGCSEAPEHKQRREEIRRDGVIVAAPCRHIVYRWQDGLWIILTNGESRRVETPEITCNIS